MMFKTTMDTDKQTRFGRYEILGELGRGAMGVVYKALDPQINREVAIKTISLVGLNAAEEREYRARFYREAEAAGRISHPGIVTIFDIGTEEETRAPFIVMELVSGGSLEDSLVRGDRKLNLESALRLATELAQALDCAHGHGVVHRDLKPANILLTQEGHAKIADFGIAKLNLANITLLGNSLGTPSYMSPEQLNGEAVDGRSDLFSLGAVLYTVLTGYKPFQGNSVLTVSFKVVNRNPVPATVLNSQLPAALDHIIGRAMSKDPATRYQTGAEMAADMQALREGKEPQDEEIPNYVSRRTSGTIGKPLSPAHIAHKMLKSRRVGAKVLVGAAIVTGLCLYEVRTIAFSPEAVTRSTSEQRSAKSDAIKRSTPAMDSLRALNVISSAPVFSPANPETIKAPQTDTRVGRSGEPSTISPPAKRSAVSSRKNLQKSSNTPAVSTIPIASSIVPETPQAEVRVEVEHSFASGTLTIWVDSKLTFSHSLESINKKHLVLFHRLQGHEFYSMHIPSGTHLLRADVSSGQGSNDQSATITENFTGQEGTLLVAFDKRGKLIVSLH
jgi:serine/threonine protein kinase